MNDIKRPIFALRLLMCIIAVGGLAAGVTPVARGFSNSGMSLELFVAKGQEDLHYSLDEPNDPVTLFIVLCNETDKPIVTEKGFSQIDLHHAIIVTEMNRENGVKHYLRPTHQTHKMPEPYTLNERLWILAEEVPARLPNGGKYCMSAKVKDLREFVPAMRKIPGVYNVSASLPFTRFAVTGREPGLGFIGQL